MTGVCLFLGFMAGIAFAALVAALLPRWIRFGMERREETDEPQETRPQRESRELTRLRRQLAEIERYNGSAAYGTEADE